MPNRRRLQPPAYAEIHDDTAAATVTAFTERALDWLLDYEIVAERLMSDYEFAYVHNRLHARPPWSSERSATSATGHRARRLDALEYRARGLVLSSTRPVTTEGASS